MKLLEQVKIRAAGKLIPLAVHFDLTHRCHQRCLHCYLPEAWRKGEGPGPELPTTQVKDILDQLAAAGTFLLTLSGGEVFVRPDLFSILEHARHLNFSISLMSSGSQELTREGLKFLKDLGLQGLVVTLFSLHAPVHDGITGVGGSWDRVMQTVSTGRELGVPLVLNCIAFPVNASEIRLIKRFARQEGIPLRLDNVLKPRWDGQPHPAELLLSPQQKTRLEEFAEEGEAPDPVSGCPIPEAPPGGCGAGWGSCYIGPTGEVWPCVDIPVSCGQLNGKQSFAAIWRDSPILKKLRSLMAEPQDEVMLCKVYQQHL